MTYTANYLRVLCELSLLVMSLGFSFNAYAGCNQGKGNNDEDIPETPLYEIDYNEALQVRFSGCIVPLSYAQEAIKLMNQGEMPKEFLSTELEVYKEEKQDPIVTIIRMEHRGDFKILPHSYVEYLVENVYPLSLEENPSLARNLNVGNLDPLNERVKYWVIPSSWYPISRISRFPCPVRIRYIKWIRLDTDTKLFK